MNIHSADLSRHSLRLKNYDYTQAGAYFVTICTQGQGMPVWEKLGTVECQLNEAWAVLLMQEWWPELTPDSFVMRSHLDSFSDPNAQSHIHGIIGHCGQMIRVPVACET